MIKREGTVYDMPDFILVRRAVASGRQGRKKQARWAHVSHTFALGSTYARQLCQRFEMDPDEVV